MLKISELMLRAAESLGRQQLFWSVLEEAGNGLILHEVKVQKEICEMIVKLADKEEDRIWQDWAKKNLNDCNEVIAKLEMDGVIDSVEKMMEKENG